MRVVLFAVLFATASTPALAADKPEPKYKGKPLAYWVERLQNEPLDANQQLAALAIIAFKNDAAPAVPQLLVLLDDTFNLPLNAAQALGELDPAAKDALPALKALAPKRDLSDFPSAPPTPAYSYSSLPPLQRASQQAAAEAIDKIENKPKPKRNVTKDLLRY